MKPKTAILIKTFRRDACLLNTLASIERYCDVPYRLYIADDGPISPAKEARYAELTRQGHCILLLDQPTSVGAARNAMLDRMEDEALVLRIDDDFEFFEQTKISVLQAILDFDSSLAAVADIEIQCGDGKGVSDGEISENQGYFDFQSNVLYKFSVPVAEWQWLKAGEYRYAYADHTRNFLLIRRSFLNEHRWDESIYFKREHSDFMLAIAKAGWRLGFTPDCVHRHRDDLAKQSLNENYTTQKKGKVFSDQSDAVFLSKWRVRKVVSKVDAAAVAKIMQRRVRPQA